MKHKHLTTEERKQRQLADQRRRNLAVKGVYADGFRAFVAPPGEPNDFGIVHAPASIRSYFNLGDGARWRPSLPEGC
ncbi:hypothetical protein [Telmatospirillum sp.]|uniref:hypothetical protein n=1 Tax=Telmatospirillum sp. TaxID=2079197 RepID=UPI00284426DE|nr:hypothetical protein [Telmatospirillum sp.]MDR3436411.1 hypothetical protein [Telmatospirillum sp.]